MENLFCQLRGARESISANMLLKKMPITLPEEYNHFHSTWDSLIEKTLNNLSTRLWREQDRLQGKQQSEVIGKAFVRKDRKF